jgi:hypothetical protein
VQVTAFEDIGGHRLAACWSASASDPNGAISAGSVKADPRATHELSENDRAVPCHVAEFRL